MSKAASSFYDWEMTLRGNTTESPKKEKQEEKKAQNTKEPTQTSLGISKEEFRSFVAEWKKKNL
jgi:hypothetical protein